jgi:hypothetical protein
VEGLRGFFRYIYVRVNMIMRNWVLNWLQFKTSAPSLTFKGKAFTISDFNREVFRG